MESLLPLAQQVGEKLKARKETVGVSESSAGGLISTTRLTGQTVGATVVAALLAVGLGTSRVPALIAASMTVIAGLCSLARLRPSIRNPRGEETAAAQPGAQGSVNAA